MGPSVWSEFRERLAPCYSQTSDMRLWGRWRVPMASLKAKQGSSITHGDANENDDVLACASTAAFGASGRAGRAAAAELAAWQTPMVLRGAICATLPALWVSALLGHRALAAMSP